MIWAFIYSNLIGNSIGLNICGMWGIWHGNTFYYDQVWCYGQESSTGSPLVRENIVPTRWVPRNYIVDLADNNYDCDWSAIYEEIINIVREISPTMAQ